MGARAAELGDSVLYILDAINNNDTRAVIPLDALGVLYRHAVLI